MARGMWCWVIAGLGALATGIYCAWPTLRDRWGRWWLGEFYDDLYNSSAPDDLP